MNSKKNKGPQRINKILQDAKKEWMRSKVEYYLNSPQSSQIHSMKKEVGAEIVFLYIDGDPNYIRTIFLN